MFQVQRGIQLLPFFDDIFQRANDSSERAEDYFEVSKDTAEELGESFSLLLCVLFQGSHRSGKSEKCQGK